jgi:hypothetical protein
MSTLMSGALILWVWDLQSIGGQCLLAAGSLSNSILSDTARQMMHKKWFVSFVDSQERFSIELVREIKSRWG